MNKLIDFSEEECKYIEQFAKEHEIKSFTTSLKQIIREHKESPAVEKRIVDAIDDKYKNLFTRLRLGTNETDKNVQIILECINAIASKYAIEALPTDLVETTLLKESRETVKERIKGYKEKKDWKKK